MTRDEWNAAYLVAVLLYHEAPDLSVALRCGICYLTHMGYTDWKGLVVSDPNDPDSVAKNYDSPHGASTCDLHPPNDGLIQLMQGTLQIKDRARTTIEWLEDLKIAPELVQALRMLL